MVKDSSMSTYVATCTNLKFNFKPTLYSSIIAIHITLKTVQNLLCQNYFSIATDNPYF